MPIFARSRKGRNVSSGSTTVPSVAFAEEENPYHVATLPVEEKQIEEPTDPWLRNEVQGEDVQELLHVCTQEIKSRALDMPLLLLPFRPVQSDGSAAKTFIRNYFQASLGARYGTSIYNDLKLIDPMALCSIMKWCWSRLKGGVVTWNTYELFRTGEHRSHMAKHAFDTFIPLSVGSPARGQIVFDFFDLLAAIAANSQTNGLGARKLSRLAGWWAFDHDENAADFQDAYKSWSRAADATSHLFFAYLRSLAPDSKVNSTMSQLPRYLQKLVVETEYPPQTPHVLRSATSKVALSVSTFSTTPSNLLQRAKRLDYRNGDPGLQRICLDDGVTQLLTPECRRVLECFAADSIIVAPKGKTGTKVPASASWSRFEDTGFASLLDGTASPAPSPEKRQKRNNRNASNSAPAPAPSWFEFSNTGFVDDGILQDAGALTLPTEQILPPIRKSRDTLTSRHKSSQESQDRKPPEVGRVDQIELDETFWWVWMASLAVEESPARKAIFSRCLVLETEMRGRRWLVLEERLRAMSPPPTVEETIIEEEPIVVEKRTKFKFSKRGRGQRSASGAKQLEPTQVYREPEQPVIAIKMHTGPDEEQKARVQAAAAALVQEKQDQELAKTLRRRGRRDEDAQSKTASVTTLRPVLAKEAGPALQWARKFDKEIIRARYLGDAYAGRGGGLREISPNLGPGNHHHQPMGRYELEHRELPALPRRSMLSLNPDVLSLASPTPPPGARRSPSRLEELHRPTTPEPVAAVVQGSAASKSLVPSPLMPRRKAVGSIGSIGTMEMPIIERRVHTDPFAAQHAREISEDPIHGQSTHTPEEVNTETVTHVQIRTPSPQLKKQSSVRGLRKFFGKRVASEPSQSITASRRALFEGLQAQQQPLKPKKSFLRRKLSKAVMQPRHSIEPEERPISPVEQEESHHHPIRTSSIQAEEMLTAREPSPVNMEPFPIYIDRSADNHEEFLYENNYMNPTFSNFSQGHVTDDEPNWTRHAVDSSPMEELPMHINDFHHHHDPAFEPLSAPRARRVTPPTHFNTQTAAMLYKASIAQEPTTPTFKAPKHMRTRLESDPELTADSGSSNGVTPELRGGEWGVTPNASKWAETWKNATVRRVSEEKQGQQMQRPQVGERQMSNDGEESIEARVARIKARVAELTGSSPSLTTSPTYLKYGAHA